MLQPALVTFFMAAVEQILSVSCTQLGLLLFSNYPRTHVDTRETQYSALKGIRMRVFSRTRVTKSINCSNYHLLAFQASSTNLKSEQHQISP